MCNEHVYIHTCIIYLCMFCTVYMYVRVHVHVHVHACIRRKETKGSKQIKQTLSCLVWDYEGAGVRTHKDLGFIHVHIYSTCIHIIKSNISQSSSA